ncbi:cyclophilin-like fold protein [Sanguibacter sp. 25GB23B1]|uniref:cyclophilin-like fold protein n=1 Tax=unclassified Sanguibacter TaxID=2645534 RepID=UPI0032AED89A
MTRTPIRLAALGAGLTLVALLTSCTSSPVPDASPATGTPTPTPAGPAPSPAPVSTTTPIVIELDGHQTTGELDASATSASLVAQLPLTLPLRDFGGQEKLAELPVPLDLDGAPAGSAAPALTIGYYVPDQALILYYEDVGYFSGIVPLGTYDDAAALENRADELTITLRSAE